MDKSQTIVSIPKNSLLDLLPPAEVQRLLPFIEVRELSPGAEVPRASTPAELFIVAEGEVSLYSMKGGVRQKVDGILSGRSIELEALLSGALTWTYVWAVESRVTLLRLPYAEFERSANEVPDLLGYLKKVTLHRELQKFKNDIRLFGLPQNLLPATFRSMQSMPWAEFAQSYSESSTGLLILGRGELRPMARIQGQLAHLGEYRAADCVFWDFSRSLEAEADPDTELWWLESDQWARSVRSHKVSYFLRLADPIGQRLQFLKAVRGPAKESEEGAAEAVEASIGEDGDVDDFTVSESSPAQKYKPILIPQAEDMDCGAACMASVAQTFGRRVGIAKMRSLVGVSREGASMYSLAVAANAIGIRAMGLGMDYDGLQTLLTPFIALADYHFVVGYRATAKRILVGDPAGDIRWISREEFVEKWSGTVLALRPTPKLYQVPESPANLNLGKYLALFRGLGPRLLEAGAGSAVVFIAGISVPILLQLLLDSATSTKSNASISVMGLITLGLAVTSGLVLWARSVLISYFSAQVEGRFSSLFMRRNMKQALSFFMSITPTDVPRRLADFRGLKTFFQEEAFQALVGLAIGFGYILVMGGYQSILLVPIVIAVLVTVLALRLLSKRFAALHINFAKAYDKSFAQAHEQFRALEALKSINAMVAARWRWEFNALARLRASRRVHTANYLVRGGTSLGLQLVVVSVLVLAIHLNWQGKLSVGQVAAVDGMVLAIMLPITSLIDQWPNIQRMRVSVNRIDAMLERDPEMEGGDKKLHIVDEDSSIELRDVKFSYGDHSSPILKGISLRIETGETVAFVGGSGSGKSTLGYLLNSLYVPTSGDVVVGGVNVKGVAPAQLRKKVGMVLQDSLLFSGTILSNIVFGDNHPSFARVVEAARLAGAHDFISKLSNGYSTLLGEEGTGLSGGQKQKINIARALYREPHILVLDEATSAMDAISEEQIVHNLKTYHKARTKVIIAHRLNTVIQADRIYVLKDGTVAESGTHDELLMKRGHYANLFQNQLNLGL